MVFVRSNVPKVLFASVCKNGRCRHGTFEATSMISRFVYATWLCNLKWNFTLSYFTACQPSNICCCIFSMELTIDDSIFVHVHGYVYVCRIFHHFSLKSIINSLNIWYYFHRKSTTPTNVYIQYTCQEIDKKNVILRMMHLQLTVHFYDETCLMHTHKNNSNNR